MKMKIWLILLMVTVGVAFGQEGGKCDKCTPTPPPGPTPGPNSAPDPAFFGVDKTPKPQQLNAKSKSEAKALPKLDLGSYSEAEQAAWVKWEKELKNDPRKGYQLTLEVWEANYTKMFQRQAILQARARVETTDERSNLDFMLGCLEDVKVQRAACLKLGKGNGLERQLGARRLALLESNPQLAGK